MSTRLGEGQQALDQLQTAAAPDARGLEFGVVVVGAFQLEGLLPGLQHDASVLAGLELVAHGARRDVGLHEAEEADGGEDVDRLGADARAGHAHGGLDLQEAAHPCLGDLDLLLEAAAGAGGAHVQALGADAERGGAARAHLAQRAPEPCGEIDVGGAGGDVAHGLEDGGVDD